MSDSTASKTIFSKIVDREIPAVIVYEDALTIAFLDHNPVTPGHLLVIPKAPINHLDDCPEDLYAAIFSTVRLLSRQLKQQLQPERIGLSVNGYDVPHAHVHIIPMYQRDDLKFPERPKEFPTPAELQAIADKLRLTPRG